MSNSESLQELFTAWNEVRKFATARISNFNEYKAALEGDLKEKYAVVEREMGVWNPLIVRMEQKRANLDAEDYGLDLPFPEVEETIEVLISAAKQFLGAVNGEVPVGNTAETETGTVTESTTETSTENDVITSTEITA